MAKRRFFRLTSQGRSLWERRKVLPLSHEHRRILGLVDYSGFPEVIRSYLAHYPGPTVDGWLSECEALRLIESIAASEVSLEKLARKTEPPPLLPADLSNRDLEVSFADISLSRLGVYINDERLSNRPSAAKRVESTVALVVEDDPDQRALAVLRLTSAGYPVETAEDVRSFFAYLKQRTPDAVFLDVGLPDGDGFDMLARLRQHPTYAFLPIIMLTARSAPEDIAKGLALGADGYVTKPYGRNTLDYVLRYIMNQEVSVHAHDEEVDA